MGSPLSPILSNLVMEDLETACLSQLPLIVPFYIRYVDDILIAIPNDSLTLVLDTFNSFHPRLQFTSELQVDDRINFLDVTVINNREGLTTDWYHKPTWSRRYLNFHSHHPVQQEIGIIYGLVDRSILLSDASFHLTNLELVRQVLLENNYPGKFVDTHISRRINTLVERSRNSDNLHNLELNNNRTEKFCFPYIKGISQSVARTLRPFNVSCVFRNVSGLSKLYSQLKDKTPLSHTSNVVYRIPCGGCTASYIGPC